MLLSPLFPYIGCIFYCMWLSNYGISQGKEVRDEDEFVYNREFRHRMCQIKINQVQLKETVSTL